MLRRLSAAFLKKNKNKKTKHFLNAFYNMGTTHHWGYIFQAGLRLAVQLGLLTATILNMLAGDAI